MNKFIISITAVWLCLIYSCAAPQKITDSMPDESIEYTFDVSITNNTQFDLEILDDSRVIPKNGEKKVTLPAFFNELNDGYRIIYRVKLLDDIFIRIPRMENLVIKREQKSASIESVDFESNLCFLLLQNEGNQIISLKTDIAYLSAIEQAEPRKYGSPTLAPGKSHICEITPGPVNLMVESDYRSVGLLFDTAKPGYIYSFLYTVNGITLTDSRPLYRVGESAWAETIPEANATLKLAVKDGEIHMFAPTDNGLVRYAYDSAGNKKEQIPSGDDFQISVAIPTGNDFFIAGYEVNYSRNITIPIARIQGADGTPRRLLSMSGNPEYNSAFYNTAAQKDSTWLLAGGITQFGEPSAYARLVRDNGSALTAEWELGRAHFDAALKSNAQTASSGIGCGEIESAVYDSKRDRWLLTGNNLEFDSMLRPVVGSYLAIVNSTGDIQKIDTSLKGFSFYKILIDAQGNYYLVGEEQKGTDSLAVIVKYNADGLKLWQIPVPPSSQPAVYSYYNDAILDIENSQIVLGGTLDANDGSGNGGKPFVEGVDMEKGTSLWREVLTDPVFAGTSLVTSIVPAPDYGFVVTLSGINDYTSPPYVVARVNARGKYIK